MVNADNFYKLKSKYMKKISKAVIKKIIKIVNVNLNVIYNSSLKIAKAWDRNTIPLTTLKEIIEKSKPSTTTSIEAVNEFNAKYSKTLDSLYDVMSSHSSKMGSENIALSVLLQGINIIKANFKKSLN